MSVPPLAGFRLTVMTPSAASDWNGPSAPFSRSQRFVEHPVEALQSHVEIGGAGVERRDKIVEHASPVGHGRLGFLVRLAEDGQP